MSDELAAELADRLREAHRRVRSLQVSDDEKARLARKLLAVTESSKRDLGRAAQRLDRLMADLDERGVPGPDAPGEAR